MSNKLFYIDTLQGCGIRVGSDEQSVRDAITRSSGTDNRIRDVREATEADISWVKGMGGYVPEL
jgi:hypothetical protein